MIDVKATERPTPPVEGSVAQTEPRLPLVEDSGRDVVRLETPGVVDESIADDAAGDPTAAREGLFQILSLSKSRIHARILTERRGVKGKKEAKEIARGIRRGAKIEGQIRVQAEEKIDQGATPQDKCLGIDTLLALDQRRLAELTRDAKMLKEEAIPHEKRDARKRLEQELRRVEKEIVKTKESMQKLQTQREEVAQGVEIPNEVVDFIHKVVGPYALTENPLQVSLEKLAENPLGALEEFLTKAAAHPKGKEVVVELVKQHIPEESAEKEVKKVLNPTDRKKISLMSLLFLLGVPGLVAFNALKSTKQNQQG